MNSNEGRHKSAETSPSYGQILKSTSIIGGAQGINLLLGIVRVKFAAVLIGPVGVGLVGNFQAVQGVMATLAGFGIQTSAVRDVAQAISENNPERMGKTILALRRFCWMSGLLGAVMIAGLSPWLSQWTFRSRAYASQIAWMGVVILLGNLSGGQMAVIQGMRRIGDLARIEIISATAGTVITVVAYKSLGIEGIIPALLLMAAIKYGISWKFARQIAIPPVLASWRESLAEAGGMARLGFVLMWNALLSSTALFLTRAWITQDFGIAAVGIFGAAFGLSGMLMNFILSAMAADYYPRLTGVADDPRVMIRLVNEQTAVGLLLVVPILVSTLWLAPWIVEVFYTDEFRPAIALLQWFALGCLGKVISWPMGFVMLALNLRRWFFATQTLFTIVHLLLIWLGLRLSDLNGVGIAFCGLYLFSTVVVYILSARLIRFRWSEEVIRLFMVLGPMVAIAFVGPRILSTGPAIILGVVTSTSAGIICLQKLLKYIGPDHPIVRRTLRVPIARHILMR